MGEHEATPGRQEENYQQEYGEEAFAKSHGITSGLYTHEIASSPDHRAAADALEALERDQSQDAESSHRHRNLLKLLMTGRISLTFKIDLQTEEALARIRDLRERKVWEVKQQLNHYDHLVQLKSNMLQGATANIFFTYFDPANGGLDIQVPPSSSQGDSQLPYGDEVYGDERDYGE